MATNATIENAAASAALRSQRVSKFHLYGLRILFFLMALFLLSAVAPLLPESAPTHMTSVARALLAGLGLLAIVGIRYPLQMLPLMLFELAWKVLWLAFYGLPAWSAGEMDPAYASSLKETGIGVILVIVVVPWRYVFDHYVTKAGDRWR
ncbi:MAG TPA: hypothetical protein VD887_12580 [Allosphingosinicella sp.]|nr:hypothetical protein [Allosphingosinicella sp.]